MVVCITSRSSSSTLISCGDGVVVGPVCEHQGAAASMLAGNPSAAASTTGGFVGPSTERACWGLLDLFKR